MSFSLSFVHCTCSGFNVHASPPLSSCMFYLRVLCLLLCLKYSDGRSDRELADIWWRNHLKRELSIVVALFTGQYKSVLTCAHCQYASARFEPFTFLQLPLPEETHRNMAIILVLANGSNLASRLNLTFSRTIEVVTT